MTADTKEFDLICIGGGSGGLACARKAAKYGKKVALIEMKHIGGTCVNVGCVPKKLIYNASTIYEDIEIGQDIGLLLDKKGFDWAKMKEKRDAYIKKLHDIYTNNCKKDGVEYIIGKGKFLSAHEVQVVNEEAKTQMVLKAPHIVISTGSKSLYPAKLPGITYTFNSDAFFDLKELPKTLFIIGGGYIGVEISCMLSTFGVKTTICMLEPSIVWPFDREITKIQMENMTKLGIEIIPESKVMGVEKLGEKHYRVNFDKHAPVEAEQVMCAMGRVPNYDGLDIEKLGIKLNAMRGIETDEFENTNVPGVYCIGDTNTKLMLTPVAIQAGRHLAERLFGGIAGSKLNYDCIPSVVFSHPPMGKIGLSEEEAVAKYGKEKIKVYKSQFNQLFYALTDKKVTTFMKIVCLLPEEKVLGMHGVGRGIDEIIQGFAVGVRMGITKKELDLTVAIHPTVAEEFVTMT